MLNGISFAQQHSAMMNSSNSTNEIENSANIFQSDSTQKLKANMVETGDIAHFSSSVSDRPHNQRSITSDVNMVKPATGIFPANSVHSISRDNECNTNNVATSDETPATIVASIDKYGKRITLLNRATALYATVADKVSPNIVNHLPVYFAKGYNLASFISKDQATQHKELALIDTLTARGSRVVFIGPPGLPGGGFLNWLGKKSCTMMFCFDPVWQCICGYRCIDNSCFIHCNKHQSSHRCTQCRRFSRCPQYESNRCTICCSNRICSDCCGCYEKAAEKERIALALQARQRQELERELRNERLRREEEERRLRQEQEEARWRREQEEARWRREQEEVRLRRENEARWRREEQERFHREEEARQSGILQKLTKELAAVELPAVNFSEHQNLSESAINTTNKQDQKQSIATDVSAANTNTVIAASISSKQLSLLPDLITPPAIFPLDSVSFFPGYVPDCAPDSNTTTTPAANDSATIDVLPLAPFADQMPVQNNLLDKPSGSIVSDSPLPRLFKHYTSILSTEGQATFTTTLAPILIEKLGPVDESLQTALVDHWISTGVIYTDIIHSYPVESWHLQSLLQSVVETFDNHQLQQFRAVWYPLSMHCNQEQQIRLLTAIIEHSPSFTTVLKLCYFITNTGNDGYELAYTNPNQSLPDLSALWLRERISRLGQFTATEQELLCRNISHTSWSIPVMEQFLLFISDATDLDAIVALIDLVKTNKLPECLLLRSLASATATANDNAISVKEIQVTHSKVTICQTHISSQLLYHMLYSDSPELAELLIPTLQALLASGCNYNSLSHLLQRHRHRMIDHPEQFSSVLKLLFNYQLKDQFCPSRISPFLEEPAETWISLVDSYLVDQLFSINIPISAEEAIEQIAVSSPGYNQASLHQDYNALLAAYNAPSTISNLAKINGIPIRKWDKNGINEWKTRFNSASSIRLSEQLAVVKRAVELHHNYSPRSIQLLAVLVLLASPAAHGRLVQINTGEGKSLIIAMLAIIKVLQGKQVDIITSSTELSRPECDKQRGLYSLFDLSCGENSELSGKAAAYRCSIVYGTAGDFQADLLREEFLGDNLRGDRKYDCVLVDEVDSLLFDQRSHSVRLSSPIPGMEALTLPLAAIWQKLHQIVRHMIVIDKQLYFIPEAFTRNGKFVKLVSGRAWQDVAIAVVDEKIEFIRSELHECFSNLLRTLTPEESKDYADHQLLQHTLAQAQEKLDQFGNSATSKLKNDIEQLKSELNTSPWHQNPILPLPDYLRNYAQQQLTNWIENALQAAYAYKRDAHYTVVNQRIVPIAYNENGSLQPNLIWSDGLTQFLQMKEGLAVDPEGLSTNYISNISFFKRYGPSIYGLTGSLGDTATQQFLQELYATDCLVIPPYQSRKILANESSDYHCKELAPIIIDDEAKWYQHIITNALHHARRNRAVLLICKYIQQAEYLYKQLAEHHPSEKLLTYTGKEVEFKNQQLASGQILIATNIAGRGTDLLTDSQIEQAGGLYVAITFLPDSYRVELQNVGRTARFGNKGMAQLILYDAAGRSIQALKSARQKVESDSCLAAITAAKQLLGQDTLFSSFCRLENMYLPGLTASRWQSYSYRWLEPTVLDKYLSDWQKQARIALQAAKRATTHATQEYNQLNSQNQQRYADAVNEQLTLDTKQAKDAYQMKVLASFAQKEGIDEKDLQYLLTDNGCFTELAKRYEWGEYERQALEERWACWSKINHSKLAVCDTASMLKIFSDEFATQIATDAQNDQLIVNPYYHLLKGNSWLALSALNKAIVCYDRAIAMAPDYSVNAYYQKARALLSYRQNSGQKQQQAYQALQAAKDSIDTTLRQNLLTIHTLLAMTGKPINTVRHLQDQLDILNQQENYIDKAMQVIKEALEKRYHVKLTLEPLRQSFYRTDHDRSKAFILSQRNGLKDLFAVELVVPIPWWRVAGITLLGLAQITVGIMFIIGSAGTLGTNLLSEGCDDLFTAVKIICGKDIKWNGWLMQKGISLCISLVCAGFSKVKKGLKEAKGAIKSLTGRTGVRVVKGSGELVKREITRAFTSGIIKECYSATAQWKTNEFVVEKMKKRLTVEVMDKLHASLDNDPLVAEALALDRQQGSNHWQKLLLSISFKILQKNQMHPCLYMLKEIVTSVAQQKFVAEFNDNNNVQCAEEILLLAKFTKHMAEIDSYIDEFVSKYKAELKKHESAIKEQQKQLKVNKAAETSQAAQTATVLTETKISCQDPPPLALDEAEITTDQLCESDSYQSEQQTSYEPLQHCYFTVKAVTPAALVNELQGQLVQELLSETMQSLRPIISYAGNKLIKQIFKEYDQKTAHLRYVLITDKEGLEKPNVLANMSKKVAPQSKKSKKKDPQRENPKREASELKQQVDMAAVERVKFTLNNDLPQDMIILSLYSNVLGQPIYICNNNGVVESKLGTELNGEPILIQYISGSEANESNHWAPLLPHQAINPSGQNSCGLDSIWSQLSESNRAKFKDQQELKDAIIDCATKNSQLVNEFYLNKDELQMIAPERVKEGGKVLSIPTEAAMKLEEYIDNNPYIKKFLQKTGVALDTALTLIGAGKFLLAANPTTVAVSVIACHAVTYLINEYYDVCMDFIKLNCAEGKEKLATFLKQNVDNDLTPEQANWLADKAIKILRQTGKALVNYGAGKAIGKAAIAGQKFVTNCKGETITPQVKIDSVFKRNKSGKKIGIKHTQKHHIVFQQFKDHPAVIASGMDINDPKNIIYLPTKDGKKVFNTKKLPHQGRHTKVVTKELEKKLDDIRDEGIKNNWMESQYKEKLYELIGKERKELREGKNLYKKTPLTE